MWNEGGGAKPPTKPLNQIVSDAVREQPPLEALPRTTAAWLENHAELSHLHLHLAEEDLASLCDRLTSDRVGLLSHFKAKGVTRLADRQKLANCLGRDRREGMFWLPGDPPPTRATQPTRTCRRRRQRRRLRESGHRIPREIHSQAGAA